MRNVFACLVHENEVCVLDLVRNLRTLDPSSDIILYNGGTDDALLRRFPFERYGAAIHPAPQHLSWGRLHAFAVDCMDFALRQTAFDVLTIVDSDQLSVRENYSSHVVVTDRTGILCNSPSVQPPGSRIGPAAAAVREIDLWRPFLQRFPGGEAKFPHWSFWPSTVFTRAAAAGIVRLFRTDSQLNDILSQSRIWASEEVILPTLAALLGFDVETNPCSYDLVQYQRQYSLPQVEAAFAREDVYWIHPVPRVYDDPVRKRVRDRFFHYQESRALAPVSAAPKLLLTRPIVERVKTIEGWLEEDEADLLIASAAQALRQSPADAVVEVGSYCGRSTVALASVISSVRPEARVYALDPGEGVVGAAGQGLSQLPATFQRFQANIAAAGVDAFVTAVREYSFNVEWHQPIAYLFIDGLHDYANAARDFHHFEPWLAPDALIAFHDYAEYYPGIIALVNELLATGRYGFVERVRSLIVLSNGAKAPVHTGPLVSCILPTRNRRDLVPQSVNYFLRQDYPNRELIVVDDSDQPVKDLLPSDDRIRYVRIPSVRSIGEKRNIACEEARGDVVAHWDDDDWIAPHRLSAQVGHLQRSSAQVCGLDRVLFFAPVELRAWQYVYPFNARRWVHGASLCYQKQVWRSHRFHDINEGEDATFVWSLPEHTVLPLPDNGFLVGMVHTRNTSRKYTEDARWQSISTAIIRDTIAADWPFYEGWAERIRAAAR